jgi:hypothetical protein
MFNIDIPYLVKFQGGACRLEMGLFIIFHGGMELFSEINV